MNALANLYGWAAERALESGDIDSFVEHSQSEIDARGGL